MNVQLTPEYLVKAINELKKKHNAIVLAHYYVPAEVQDVADFVGDSLELSRKAAASDADMIVFCGVRFMAETAAVLAPGKKVLLPVPDAGCSLADSISGKDLETWRKRHDDGVVISYVNTTADTKAQTDMCCTSANAVDVARKVCAANPERPVLFAPDRNLGGYINSKAALKMELWKGCCHVHESITSKVIEDALKRYPEADILIHPEAACSSDPKITGSSRCFFYSTSGIIRHVKESDKTQFVIATELGVMHRLSQEAPGKELIPLSEDLICGDMKKVTLLSLFETLLHQSDRKVVTVEPETAEKAGVPVRKMLEL
ncbi:MAG TPA: quinolinate synthase NadA [Candidatus Coprenecus pullistercoris]|nr:quinolinate synthase NadA [Candidatus Coprenecus pullistercoris]